MRILLLTLVLSLGLAACAEDDLVVPDSGVEPHTVTLTGRFMVSPGYDHPMSGASVCWQDSTGELCTNANEFGLATLQGIPAGAEGALLVRGAGAMRTLLPMVLGDVDTFVFHRLDNYFLIPDLYAQAGVPAAPDRGVIAVQVLQRSMLSGQLQSVHGATLTLSPVATGDEMLLHTHSGRRSWEGPFYVNAKGTEIVTGANATTWGGFAYFLAVDPAAGPYTVIATQGGVVCDGAEYGVALPQVEVRARTETHARAVCD